LTGNGPDWRGQAFRVGSPLRAAAMAGRSGSGARGAPIEKPRPLSLLKVTPTRVMERPEREGDVLSGLGATASGLSAVISCTFSDGRSVSKRVCNFFSVVRCGRKGCEGGSGTICARTASHAQKCWRRTHRIPWIHRNFGYTVSGNVAKQDPRGGNII
jgi:hypothetical protein